MALFNNIDKWIKVWQDSGFGPIRSSWLEKAYNINQHIKVNLGEETIEGTFKGLSSDGGLIVDTDDGLERVIFSGEVSSSLGA
jgi:BirA family biotin operon repressor/biotin-[acetyl-CoA-carboxylase] ligase